MSGSKGRREDILFKGSLFSLQGIRRILWDHYFPKYKIEEYFLLHVDNTIDQFKNAISGSHCSFIFLEGWYSL